jgi:anaerobic nitric oxide reductase flavorubredoxin
MTMQSAQISEAIHWVGAIDWELRDFHGYETPRGTTYNAYLVRGAKAALVDTVKLNFVDELLSRVRSVMDPADVDYIVVNHVEPDHNGGLRAVMQAMPNAKVVASKSGVAGVFEYHDGLQIEAVGADDVIDLGGKTLHFLPQPMVHWPDSMFTYCPEECVLMPNDAFGQHLASEGRFADEVGLDLSLEELTIYYANILMPLGTQVAKAAEKIGELGWACKIIAPSHGVAWRGDDIGTMLATYARLTRGETLEKIVVAFSTMWGSTETLSRAVADGIGVEGVQVEVFDLALTPIAHVTRELLDARALLLGSPTLHRGMLYRVAGYLQWIAGLKPQGKIGGAFGSYGWSSGATKQISERLAEIGFELPFEPYTQKYRPTADDIQAAREWGAQFARLVKVRD